MSEIKERPPETLEEMLASAMLFEQGRMSVAEARACLLGSFDCVISHVAPLRPEVAAVAIGDAKNLLEACIGGYYDIEEKSRSRATRRTGRPNHPA